MSESLIFISRHEVPAEHVDELREISRAYTEATDSTEPDAVTLQLFLDEETRELVTVQIHQSADAADAHLQLAHGSIGRALELVQTTSILVCGEPGPLLAEGLRHNRQAGAAVTVVPTRLSGFVRPTAA